MEIQVTPCFLTPCRQEIQHFIYRKFNTGIYNELPSQHECTIVFLSLECILNQHKTFWAKKVILMYDHYTSLERHALLKSTACDFSMLDSRCILKLSVCVSSISVILGWLPIEQETRVLPNFWLLASHKALLWSTFKWCARSFRIHWFWIITRPWIGSLRLPLLEYDCWISLLRFGSITHFSGTRIFSDTVAPATTGLSTLPYTR